MLFELERKIFGMGVEIKKKNHYFASTLYQTLNIMGYWPEEGQAFIHLKLILDKF